MGRYLFRMPDVGEGVAEAEIVTWHVQVGDAIDEDQALADVMTDKATVEMTSPVAGVVTVLHGRIGEAVAVGSTLVELEVEGPGNTATEVTPDQRVARSSQAESLVQVPVAAAPVMAESAPAPFSPDQSAAPRYATGDAPFAAPATRRRAHELGIPLQYVRGTGPGGRITPDDLDRHIATGGSSDGPRGFAQRRTGVSATPIIGMRRKIAEKMVEAKRRIPHITYVEECDLTELETLRLDLNANRKDGQPKLTLLPFLVRALVRALPEFPQINARFDDQQGILHQFEAVHVGIATQTPAGLLVPVIQHAESHDVWQIAGEVARLSAQARAGSATRDELSGSTITITSLGALGGIVTTPIINHPEVAIIGPNKLVDRPVVQGSFVTVRKMMNLSSAFDHRIVDGYDAARFTQRVKRLLEHPALIFMD